jgi:hypothetical protein
MSFLGLKSKTAHPCSQTTTMNSTLTLRTFLQVVY